MTKYNKFLEYLKNEKYNEIYQEVKYYFIRNKDRLADRLSENISQVIYISDVDLYFKWVWIDDLPNDKIKFRIAISVNVEAQVRYGRHRDVDSRSLYDNWICVHCSGDLSKALQDFKIWSIEEYYNKEAQEKPLSNGMVPLLHKQDYQKIADEMLAKFYPQALDTPMQLDVNALANNMGLTIFEYPLSNSGSILGQIFFEDCVIEIQGQKTSIPAKTILVDIEAGNARSRHTNNITKAHECVHYYLHRKAYLFAKLFNGELKYIQCQSDGSINGIDDISELYQIESQAYGIAPCLLMPAKTFTRIADNLIEKYCQHNAIIDCAETIIQELAETFGVTIHSARKRLIDLGYEFAIGALNWIDGGYLRPYTFAKGSLQERETFAVSYKDIYEKLLNDASLTQALYGDQYVFVEHHVCLYDTKYVEYNEKGALKLTRYALTHMDECCIKFVFSSPKNTITKNNLDTYYYLCRDTSLALEFDLEMVKGESISDVENYPEKFVKHHENIKEIKRMIVGRNFGEILGMLMDKLDIPTKELAYDSGISERTIRRYLHNENIKPEKRTCVALLRALNIPVVLSLAILDQAGLSLSDANKEDNAFMSILQCFRDKDVEEADEFLISLNFQPLSKEN